MTRRWKKTKARKTVKIDARFSIYIHQEIADRLELTVGDILLWEVDERNHRLILTPAKIVKRDG